MTAAFIFFLDEERCRQDDDEHPNDGQCSGLAQVTLEGREIGGHVSGHASDHGPAQPFMHFLVEAGVRVEEHQDAGAAHQDKGANGERRGPFARDLHDVVSSWL